MILNPGDNFNSRYIIKNKLGSGAMGDVYLANDELLNNQEIVIKFLKAEVATDEKQLQRFIQEVQLTRKVNHKNVVRTFDIGNVDNQLYFTMELANGQTLKELIESDHKLKLEDALNIVKEIINGLDAIHLKGIIHRDLKPANIIITDDNDVKIMDFGIARSVSSEITAQNEIIGTSKYLAPEIWKGEKATEATDFYALGIIIYQLFSGISPFEADSSAQMMYKHLSETPVKVSEYNNSIPKFIDNLIQRLLEKKIEDRFERSEDIIYFIDSGLRDLDQAEKNTTVSFDENILYSDLYSNKPQITPNIKIDAQKKASTNNKQESLNKTVINTGSLFSRFIVLLAFIISLYFSTDFMALVNKVLPMGSELLSTLNIVLKYVYTAISLSLLFSFFNLLSSRSTISSLFIKYFIYSVIFLLITSIVYNFILLFNYYSNFGTISFSIFLLNFKNIYNFLIVDILSSIFLMPKAVFVGLSSYSGVPSFVKSAVPNLYTIIFFIVSILYFKLTSISLFSFNKFVSNIYSILFSSLLFLEIYILRFYERLGSMEFKLNDISLFGIEFMYSDIHFYLMILNLIIFFVYYQTKKRLI